jgi:hypothetical protein
MGRSRKVLLGALAAAIALAQSVGALAETASAATPGWRVVATVGSKSHPGLMEAVAAASPADAYAFGALTTRTSPDTYTAIVRRWNGRSWGPAAVPAGVTAALSGFPSTVATASSASNVWAFTGSGAWVRYNGKHWSHGELPIEKPSDDGDITAAVAFNSHDVWALGYYNLVSPLPYIAHFNGRHWQLTNLYLNTAIVSVSALSPDNIWAAGTDNTNLVLHYNGRSWKQVQIPAKLAVPAYFQGIVALSAKSVWVTGDLKAQAGAVVPGVLHWNGRGWAGIALKSPDPLINATADGHGGIWAVAQEPGSVKPFRPMLWHFSDGRWRSSHVVGSDTADFVDTFAAIPGTSSMWAVGVFRSGGLDLPAILLDGRVPR